MKSLYSDFSWSIFSRIWTEYAKLYEPEKLRIRHFLRSVYNLQSRTCLGLVKHFWGTFSNLLRKCLTAIAVNYFRNRAPQMLDSVLNTPLKIVILSLTTKHLLGILMCYWSCCNRTTAIFINIPHTIWYTLNAPGPFVTSKYPSSCYIKGENGTSWAHNGNIKAT